MSLKKELYRAAEQLLIEKYETLQDALNAARAAANDETKSSAGDKYETGRAMAQLEKEKLARQIREADALRSVLLSLDPQQKPSEKVLAGSLVETDGGFFYISIPMGRVMIADEAYFIVSPGSPVGQLLLQKKEGDSVVLNGRVLLIKKIH